MKCHLRPWYHGTMALYQQGRARKRIRTIVFEFEMRGLLVSAAAKITESHPAKLFRRQNNFSRCSEQFLDVSYIWRFGRDAEFCCQAARRLRLQFRPTISIQSQHLLVCIELHRSSFLCARII